MKYVDFQSTGLRLSKIAFGCAPVMGRVGRRQALNAMNAAFDAGITHFDVARSYGYGEAESVLGHFVSGKRHQITIATKVGILPPKRQRAMQAIKPILRFAAPRIRGLQSLMHSVAPRTLSTGIFDVETASQSFEQSLRALDVDYVDILFLHDCSPDDQVGDELLTWIEALARDGKIRSWGLATRREWVDDLCRKLSLTPDIVQCQGGVLQQPLPTALRDIPAILHSPFGGPGGICKARELSHAARIALNVAPEVDFASVSTLLPHLMLESALFLADGNAVLCSMFEPGHILENVKAVERPQFSRLQVQDFVKAMRAAPMNAGGPDDSVRASL